MLPARLSAAPQPAAAPSESTTPAATSLIAQVVFDVPLDRHFDYQTTVPLAVGQRVRAGFAGRQLTGLVVGMADSSPYVVRPLDGTVDDLPPLPADWLALVHFASRYYHYPLGQTVFTALPAGLRGAKPFALPQDLGYQLTEAGLTQRPAARAVRQCQLYDRLAQGVLPLSEAKTLWSGARKQLGTWLAEGIVAETHAAAPRPVLQVGERPTLTEEQAIAVAAVPEAGFGATLLDGVTGSGKTEVYLRLIERCLAAGQQALVLVPEINLTPQLEARFRARFPATALCCLHSQIAEGQRAKAWVAAWQGQTQLVIGTRLAVFTPLPNLGLIVVDEEHDSSFKQQEGLRYSARDLAVWRGREMGVPVVLGSATPSLESLAAAVTGRYRKVQLTTRATAAPMPTIHLVDIRRQVLRDGLSPAALAALSEGLAAQETSLVFINRRGWSPVVACTDCGWMAACPHCAARLVLHQARRRLQCHHCGHQAAIPPACPSCGNPDLKPLGEGTQRIESTLKRQFPTARIVRIDRDSVSRRSTWETVYQQVMAGEVDILIGTQMMAKGHDFPSLSRVVALNSDGALYSPDFRAEERLFALLSQVAGRAGRAGIAGQVWLQTQFPDHPLYLALSQHDTSGFMARLLETRTAEGYPPAVFQALVRADAPDDEAAMVFLRQVVAWLGTHHANPEVMVLGPAPAMLARLAGRSRAQILLQADQRPPLHGCLAALTTAAPTLAKPFGKDLRWSVDVDPLDW